MAEEFEAWKWYVEDAYLVHAHDEPEDWVRPKYMKQRSKEDTTDLTTKEEYDLINKQIEDSEGFDIDFKMFRCLFSYHPVDFDDTEFVEKPETDADLLARLSRRSIENYNQENDTGYELVKVVKANFYMYAAGEMFLITFEVCDPVTDNKPREFQARVIFSFFDEPQILVCRPKGAQESDVSTDEDAEKDAKKPRLE